MRLKELRKENKKTQAEIALILNVTQQTYARYELETSEPTIDTFCKLADYYRVSLDYLIGREFVSDAGYLSENDKTVLAMFRQLNKDNQTKAIGNIAEILLTQK